ncbi:MAG: 50S ribosomal protein L22 [Patescibacteria group bacterium]|nr:50S ribosomal protein L22 [Patescibacteria group bacterium]
MKNMEYTATAKYIHMSTRKIRLVADSIRSLSPKEALHMLGFIQKKAAKPLAQVIASAIANAKAKGVNEDGLHFKTIEIMGGPIMKRWRAVSRGMAHSYKKRMTHIRVILEDK